ncbi:MAG: protein kinase [Bacteroidales bacterium]|nr:protein kinase [Bacteroidales bacterium]
MPVQEIFLAALEIEDLQQRAAYLTEACGNDEGLHQKVQALLAAHERSGEFLDVPVMQQFAGTQAQGPRVGQDQKLQDEIDLSFLQPSSRPDSLGRLLHYEVLEVVGRGGCGIVLKAFDEKLYRVVAIKTMTPELAATSPARKRFLREARATAAIRHENVVSIYAVEEKPLPFLVMEFIDGQTLQDKINEMGPLDIQDVVSIGRQVARGLEAAHAQRLIHRDIKPANILLENGTGRPKITDFGLVRSADDASMTQSGYISGTPLYMSPEQAQGLAVDHRSDLFSLGSVLYVMCSGRPPFRAATTIGVLNRVVEEQPRPIREIIPEIPDWLVAVIAELHAKKPEQRLASAKAVEESLASQSVLSIRFSNRVSADSETVVIDPLTMENASSRMSRWFFNRRTLAILLVVFAFALPGVILLELAGVTNLRSFAISKTPDKLSSSEPQTDTAQPSISSQVLPVSSQDQNFALFFDGEDDYVDVPTLKGLGEGPLTIELFLRASANQRSVSSFPLYLSSASGQRKIQCWGGHQLSAIDCRVKGKSQYNVAHMPANQWLHVAAVFGNDPRLYINGQEPPSVSPVEQDFPEPFPEFFKLGGTLGGTNLFRGEIRGVRVSRSMKYTSPFTPPDRFGKDADTIALFLFQEGTGNRLVDHSGNEHHGEIHGNPTWGLRSPDRKAAEYVFSAGGLVNINGQSEHLRSESQLPAGPFVVSSVLLRSCNKVTDDGLAVFADCKGVIALDISGTSITDRGLAHFRHCRNLRILNCDQSRVTGSALANFMECKDLEKIGLWRIPLHLKDLLPLADRKFRHINLGGTAVTDDWLPHFKNIDDLEFLNLRYTEIGDKGLAHFQRCRKLKYLSLGKTKITDASLAYFQDCPNLEDLILSEIAITDESWKLFKGWKNLKNLDLLKTNVTANSIENLKQSLPQCRITWDGGVIEPAKP